MSTYTKAHLQKTFVAMLQRVGGGYQSKGWVDPYEGKEGERSELAQQTDSDWCQALLATDSLNRSHIVAYVTVIGFAETLRIRAVIEHLEDYGDDAFPFIGHGKMVASDSQKTPTKNRQHKGVTESMELLDRLMSRFDKNVVEL